MISRATELRLATLACLGLALLFTGFPELDLAVAGWFARDHWQAVFAADSLLVDLPYLGIPLLGRALLLALLALNAAAWLVRWPRLRRQRPLFAFLLAGLLIGPGLVVDAGFKNHFGRARPAQVEAFGGPRQFTPAFVPAGECARNCSFVSGHVATAAFAMVFGWFGGPRTRRRWLLVSLAAAGYLGLVRMATGSHFLSDCLFAWFAVYFSLWLTEAAFRRSPHGGRLRASYRTSVRAGRNWLGFGAPPTPA